MWEIRDQIIDAERRMDKNREMVASLDKQIDKIDQELKLNDQIASPAYDQIFACYKEQMEMIKLLPLQQNQEGKDKINQQLLHLQTQTEHLQQVLDQLFSEKNSLHETEHNLRELRDQTHEEYDAILNEHVQLVNTFKELRGIAGASWPGGVHINDDACV